MLNSGGLIEGKAERCPNQKKEMAGNGPRLAEDLGDEVFGGYFLILMDAALVAAWTHFRASE
jgi:hypothetical protein